MDPVKIAEELSLRIQIAVDADYRAGIADEMFYMMLLEELLEDYNIAGTPIFRRFPDGMTMLYINNTPWYGRFGPSHDDNTAHIVREIIESDRMGIIKATEGNVEDEYGNKVINLEDLKAYPKGWESVFRKS